MKDIDWSKAPEDATHWHDKYDCYVACWVKEQEGQRYYSRADGLSRKWMIDRNPLPIEKCIPRHVAQPAWAGDGMPPVGTVCEVEPHNTYWGLVTLGPVEMKIAAYHDDLVWLIDKEGKSHWTRTDKADFRPARTPEQIAAEEREKAIEEMARIGTMADTPKSMAAKLYDAGYRKVTP